jgi:hypothetical protein
MNKRSRSMIQVVEHLQAWGPEFKPQYHKKKKKKGARLVCYHQESPAGGSRNQSTAQGQRLKDHSDAACPKPAGLWNHLIQYLQGANGKNEAREEEELKLFSFFTWLTYFLPHLVQLPFFWESLQALLPTPHSCLWKFNICPLPSRPPTTVTTTHGLQGPGPGGDHLCAPRV